MPLQFSWVPSVWDALQGFHPLALLQWWGTRKSAGQVLAVHQLCPSGRSASLITGHTQLHKCWRRTNSFCTTPTEYWAKTVGTTIFSSPLLAVYSLIFLILPVFCWDGWVFLGFWFWAFCFVLFFGGCFFFFSLYSTRSSYAFCYNYWLTWANKTCWFGLKFIPDGISATFSVFLISCILLYVAKATKQMNSLGIKSLTTFIIYLATVLMILFIWQAHFLIKSVF